MEDEIKLDRESFKALASETRVSILKSLTRRRKTMTELAKELSMSVPTIKEHLGSLEAASLVRQIDDGHKWKYYELTRKGKQVAEPGQKTVWIALAVSLFAFIYTFIDYTRQGAQVFAESAKGLAPPTLQASDAIIVAAEAPPAIHLPLLILFAAVAVIAILLIARKRISA